MNLSAYINFSVLLNNSISPAKVVVVDTSNYPSASYTGPLITGPMTINALGELQIPVSENLTSGNNGWSVTVNSNPAVFTFAGGMYSGKFELYPVLNHPVETAISLVAPNKVRVTFSEPMTLTNNGWTIRYNGVAKSIVSITSAGGNDYDFAMAENYGASTVIISYTGGNSVSTATGLTLTEFSNLGQGFHFNSPQTYTPTLSDTIRVSYNPATGSAIGSTSGIELFQFSNVIVGDTPAAPGASLGVVSGITGTVEVTQPDGITTLDYISYSGGALTQAQVELRKNVEGKIPKGAWRIKYTVTHSEYEATVLDRIVTIGYDRPTAMQAPNLNVFTPILEVSDGTTYVVPGYTNQSVTRSWTGTISGVGSISAGNVILFNLVFGGQYYDADYSINLQSIAEWSLNGNTWLSIRDKINNTIGYSVDAPISLATLLGKLNDFKAEVDQKSNTCSEDDMRLIYAYAESIYDHILKRGCYGQVSGLDKWIRELDSILSDGISAVYVNTGLPLTPYSWTSPCSGSGSGEVNTASNIGNGVGVFYAKSGVDLRFKRLVAGTNMTISDQGTEVHFSATGTGEANTLGSISGTGTSIDAGKQGAVLLLKKLVQGSGISIGLDGNGNIIISNNAVGEINTAGNVGSGIGVFKNKSGAVIQLKSFKAGAGVSISENGDEITISSTGGASSGTSERNSIQFIVGVTPLAPVDGGLTYTNSSLIDADDLQVYVDGIELGVNIIDRQSYVFNAPTGTITFNAPLAHNQLIRIFYV